MMLRGGGWATAMVAVAGEALAGMVRCAIHDADDTTIYIRRYNNTVRRPAGDHEPLLTIEMPSVS